MFREVAHAAIWSIRHVRGQLTPPELAVLAPHIHPGDTCLDVGAHAGAWLFPLGKLVGKGGRAIGLEALPYYARVLRMTKVVVGSGNVEILNLAATQDGASVKVVWQDASGASLTGRTHIAGKGEGSSGTVEIAGTTIDQVCSKVAGRIGFVKIDIEGAELGALRGGLDTIRRHRPIVFSEVVEAHLQRYGHGTRMLFAYFDALDYGAFAIVNSDLLPVGAEQAAPYNDILFVPRESALGKTGPAN